MTLNSSSRCADVRKAVEDVDANLMKEIREATTIVTGANSGIGKTAAQHLSYLGGTVVLACRNVEKGNQAVKDIRNSTLCENYGLSGSDLKLLVMKLDLSSAASVQEFAEEIFRDVVDEKMPPLRLLVLNAGMYPAEPSLTVDGIDTTFQVNHFGHFMLTKVLLQNDTQVLLHNRSIRIVSVSSVGHKLWSVTSKVDDEKEVLHKIVRIPQDGFASKKAKKWDIYGSSKLCNTYFAQSANDLQADSSFANGAKITACSLHPGVVTTNIFKEGGIAKFIWEKVIGLFSKDHDQGASTTFYCCLMPDDVVGGAYFADCKQDKEGRLAKGQIGNDGRDVLWKISDELAEKILGGAM